MEAELLGEELHILLAGVERIQPHYAVRLGDHIADEAYVIVLSEFAFPESVEGQHEIHPFWRLEARSWVLAPTPTLP